MFAKIKDVIYQLDFVGPETEVLFHGRKIYRTFLGVLMSIAVMVLSILGNKDDISDVFLKSNPDESIFKSTNFSYFTLTSDFKIFFQLTYAANFTNGEFQPFTGDKNFIEVYGMKKSGIYDSFLDYWDYSVACNETNLADVYNNHLFFNSNPNDTKIYLPELISQSACLPNSLNISLYNRFDRAEEQFVQLQVDIPIDPKYNNAMFKLVLHFLQLEKNLNDIHETHRLVWNSNDIYFFYNSSRFFDVYIEENIVKLQKTAYINLYSTEETDLKNTKTYNHVESIVFNQNTPIIYNDATEMKRGLLYLTFRKSNYQLINTIKYKGVEDFISGFGGTLDLVQKIFAFIMDLLVGSFFTTDILKGVFSFHKHKLDPDQTSKMLTLLKSSSTLAEFMYKDRKANEPEAAISTETQRVQQEQVAETPKSRADLDFQLINQDPPNTPIELKEIKLSNKKLIKLTMQPNPNYQEFTDEYSTLLNLTNSVKESRVKYCEMIKLGYCPYSLKNKNRKENLENLLEYLETRKDITNIIKTGRKVDQLIYLLLSKKEREMFSLPSINLRNEGSVEKFLLRSNVNESSESMQGISESLFTEGLSSIDLTKKTERKCLKTLIRNKI